MRLRSNAFAILATIHAFSLLGCGGASDLPDLTPVSGNVKLDGQPLADASVQFEYQGEGGGISIGDTDSSGNFTLKFGSGANEGAKLGKHIVKVFTQKSTTDADGNDVQTEEKVPEKYNWNSELTVEVTTEKSEGYDFDLKSE